jgi:hypothetical protein
MYYGPDCFKEVLCNGYDAYGLRQGQLDVKAVRDRMYRAPTARERERRHATWHWTCEEVTANACFGTAVKAQEKMDRFFAGPAERPARVRRRCRTKPQAQADTLMTTANQLRGQTGHVDLTLVSV